jgi:Zn-dependent peptidase ImmA (M78 family)/DNA-binding XRE family transcriptional regulator
MVNPTRLAVARKRNGLTRTALAERIGVSPRSVSAYEDGVQPSPEVLERVARVLGFPVAFFSGEDLDTPQAGAVSFRALTKMSAIERDRALSQGALALALNGWIEQRFDLPAADLPDLSQETDPEAAAASLRQQWGLGEAPIRNMIHLLEAKGVRVYSLAVDSLNVDAYSLWHDETPLIFLNTRKSAERSRFDAGHELGHLLLHRHARKEDTRLAEDEANRFSSALLMPRAGTLARAPRLVTMQHLIAHKKHWIVSVAALNHRLHELGVTNPWQYRHLSAEIGKRGYRTDEPDPAPRESSQLLSKVFAALREDSLSRRDVAAQLDLPPSELEQLIFGLTITALDGGMRGGGPPAGPTAELRLVR